MKKIIAFISCLLLASAAIFADVSVKKLDNGQIEVTFFYPNPRATEVLLAGDFTNWQDGAEPMTKGEKGFTLVKVVPAGTVMKYKFISDGNWTEDMHEPDKVDDGFGGHNGLVDVDELIAAQGGDAPASGNTASLGTAGKANVKFNSWTHAGGQVKFNNTEDAANELDSAGINLKSYLKLSGEIEPHVPIYVELALAEQDGFDNLYKKGTTEDASGLMNALVDTVFDPMYFYGGQSSAATYLGHLKYGLNSPVVDWETGYKYAKLPPHTNVNWNTIDKEWEAGYSSVGGYSQFDFSPAFRLIPFLADNGIQIEAVAAPNRAADRAGNRYGFYGYVDGKFSTGDFNHYVDFQYNGAYGTTFDTIFDTIYEADLIAGYSLIAPFDFGAITLKANYLLNGYGSTDNGDGTKSYFVPASSDVGTVKDTYGLGLENMAANANVTFSNDLLTATAGYRFRGLQANMMYVEEGSDDHTDISDQLGDINSQRAFLNVDVTPIEGVTAGVSAYGELALNKDEKLPNSWTNTDTIQIYARPNASVSLGELLDIDATVELYGKVVYNISNDDKFTRGTESSNFLFKDAGLKFSMNLDNDYVPNFAVIYNFDNRDESYLFNTLVATAEVPFGINVQAGAGLRTANTGITTAPTNPVGFFVGGFKKLSNKVLWGATVYCQYMYAMDPYKSFNDGPQVFDYDDDSFAFGSTSDATFGQSTYATNSAIRIGLGWDL